MSILDKLILLEENELLYNFKFIYKDTLMYPFIRHSLLQKSIEDIFNMQSPYDPLKYSIFQKVNYLIKCFLYFIPKNIKSEIIFFGSDISNIRQKNTYFNRLTELFANEYLNNTILIESSDKMSFKRPRTYPKVFTNDYINIISKIKSIINIFKSEDVNKIDNFLIFLKSNYKHNFINVSIWNIIKNNLIYFSKEIKYQYEEYFKLLKRISPKIIFLEDASYGNKCIPLIMAAKELKIPIGEYQHGIISLSHPAYNFSSKLFDIYKYYLPDFYINWGKYWTKHSRLPIKNIEIGNPFLSESSLNYKIENKNENILYISSSVTPKEYIKDLIQLKNELLKINSTVIFRIHPSETFRLKNIYKPIIDAGIQIDTQPLYKTLSKMKYIIGDFSTVLFEATIFNCIIFIKDTLFNRENIDITHFNIINNMNDVVDKIKLNNYKITNSNNFWSNNWCYKYHKLINSYLA